MPKDREFHVVSDTGSEGNVVGYTTDNETGDLVIKKNEKLHGDEAGIPAVWRCYC